MNRARRAAAVWFAALCLAGCATTSKPPGGEDSLSGRLSVRADGPPPRSVSADFDLRGTASSGQLELSTPLGSRIAQASWVPGEVRVIASDGERHYPDLDALSRDMLGESIPVGALFDWLRGRPWDGAPSSMRSGPPPGFAQLGWVVDLSRYADGVVSAQREAAPLVSVRAKIDR